MHVLFVSCVLVSGILAVIVFMANITAI